MSVGCANAIARHDLLERSDIRIGRAVSTARLTCQEQQPTKALPSASEYERCVLDELQRAELSVGEAIGRVCVSAPTLDKCRTHRAP